MSGTKRLQAQLSGRPVDVADQDGLDYFLNRILQPVVRAVLDAVNRLASDAVHKTADATLDGSEGLVTVDATAGPVTITLASPRSLFHLLIVQKVDASVNAVTVAAPSGSTVNGVTSLAKSTQWDRFILVADDSAYYA